MSPADDIIRACPEFADDVVALALGVLTGRRRGETLSHISGCWRCADELAEVTSAVDQILLLAPEAAAPLGFESRAMERVRLPRPERAARSWRRPLLVALSSVLLVSSGLLAATVIGQHRAPTLTSTARSVNLTSDLPGSFQQVVGRVTVLGGTPTWLLMTVDYAGWSGQLSCQVVLRGGHIETLESFRVTSAYDSWSIPIHDSLSDVVAARLVRSDGTVLAAARLAK